MSKQQGRCPECSSIINDICLLSIGILRVIGEAKCWWHHQQQAIWWNGKRCPWSIIVAPFLFTRTGGSSTPWKRSKNDFNEKLRLTICRFCLPFPPMLLSLLSQLRGKSSPHPTSSLSLRGKSSRQTVSPKKHCGTNIPMERRQRETFFHTPRDSAFGLWVCARWGWRKNTRKSLSLKKEKSVQNRAFRVVPCHCQTYDSV